MNKNLIPMNPNLGLLIMRAMIGVVGAIHGGGKLFGAFGGDGLRAFAEVLKGMNVPVPMVSALLAGAAEFFGGIMIAVGLFPRLAAIPFAFTMFVAFFTAHHGKLIGKGSGEFALTLGAFAIGLFFTGPGRWSIGPVHGATPAPRTKA